MKRYFHKGKHVLFSLLLVVSIFIGSAGSVFAAGISINGAILDASTATVGPLRLDLLDTQGYEFFEEFKSDPTNWWVIAPPKTVVRYIEFYRFYSAAGGFSCSNVSGSDRIDIPSGVKYSSIRFSTETGEPIPVSSGTKIGDYIQSSVFSVAGTHIYDGFIYIGILKKYGVKYSYLKNYWSASTLPGNNVTFTYTLPSAPKYNLTINYQYADGTQAAAPHTESLEEGAAYSVTSPTLEGYTADKPTIAGAMGAEDITETVTYTHIPQPHTLTVNYQYTDGSQAADPHSESVMEGDSYRVSSPAISGYTPDRAVISGTMGMEDISETVTYTANAPPVSDHSLTINYIYADGSEAAETYTALLAEGDSYTVTSPSIDGYQTDRSVVSGTMGRENVFVTVIYTPYAPLVRHMLTIHYRFPDGSQAAPDFMSTLAEGESYQVPSPFVEGYSADRQRVSGTMAESDVRETVTYSPVSSPGEAAPKLTIHYVFADGTQAAPDYSAELSPGVPYSVPSPAVEGYTPDRSTVFGFMSSAGAAETVTYREGGGIILGPGGIEWNLLSGPSFDWNPITSGGIAWAPSGGGLLNWNPAADAEDFWGDGEK